MFCGAARRTQDSAFPAAVRASRLCVSPLLAVAICEPRSASVFATRPLIHFDTQGVHWLERTRESLGTAPRSTGQCGDFPGRVCEQIHDQVCVTVVDAAEE